MTTNVDDYVCGDIVYEAVEVDSCWRDMISMCDGCAFENKIQSCNDAPTCDEDNNGDRINIIWVEKKC